MRQQENIEYLEEGKAEIAITYGYGATVGKNFLQTKEEMVGELKHGSCIDDKKRSKEFVTCT